VVIVLVSFAAGTRTVSIVVTVARVGVVLELELDDNTLASATGGSGGEKSSAIMMQSER
jgi:hypothetical protein